MRILLPSLVLSALLAATAGFADTGKYSTSSDDTGMTTTASASDMSRGYLHDEIVGIKPLVGAIAFTDVLGSSTSRLAAGLQLDMNAMSFLSSNDSMKNWYIGPQTGAIFSHIGNASSNFVGSSSTTDVGNSGANMLIVPADLKLGYAFFDNIRLSAHGGGNVIYRSQSNAIAFGDNTPSSSWNIYPNVGGEFEVGFGKNVALSLRPDWTLTNGENFFTGTVGLGLALG